MWSKLQGQVLGNNSWAAIADLCSSTTDVKHARCAVPKWFDSFAVCEYLVNVAARCAVFHNFLNM